LLIAVLSNQTSLGGLQIRGHFYRGHKGTLSKRRDTIKIEVCHYNRKGNGHLESP
jgi:hypothetical protein